MTEAQQMAARINGCLPNVKAGALCFWGEWFGRPYDNIHQIVSINAPEVTPRLLKLGLYPVGTCLDDFAAHICSKYDEYGRIIREANIRGE